MAIVLAAGFTMDADKKKVEITRNGEPEKIIVNLQEVLTGKVPDVPLKAGDVIREIAPIVGGKGGGKADMAEGGGTQPEKLSHAIDAAYIAIEKMLGKK